MSKDWLAVNAEIVAKTDVLGFYAGLGVRPTRAEPNPNGWVECRAVGREDNNPSARVNVNTGRYKDFKTGEIVSLFDFAAKYGGGKYRDWADARKQLAREVGVKLPSSQESRRPIDLLDFGITTRPLDVKKWCARKDPTGAITPEAVLEAGGRVALYPKGSPAAQEVIAFPGYGPELTDAEPVAWLLVGMDGKVRMYKGGKESFHKVLVVPGSQPCLLNPYALERLAGAKTVWKVEGISDLLTLQSWIPPELRDEHVVVTNGFGAGEQVQAWHLRALEGKEVYVVGDADVPGQKGAEHWVSNLARKSTAYNLQLPFEVVPEHGKDLRDLFRETAPGEVAKEIFAETA